MHSACNGFVVHSACNGFVVHAVLIGADLWFKVAIYSFT